MEEKIRKMYRFGLLGKNISYSFSKTYFTEKFKNMQLDGYEYCNFDIQAIDEFQSILTDNLKGLNVTIPYKEQIISCLDEIDAIAKEIGAVNTIKIKKGKLKGFNTDIYGFEESLKPFLKKQHAKALVLGTGGASKAINYVLRRLKIDVLTVSRKPVKEQISYRDISKEIVNSHTVIINCTPLGTFPNIEKCPEIPYNYISTKHLLYDLIYNPSKTTFLSNGEENGATICNGLKMLELQAEKSWEIWNQ